VNTRTLIAKACTLVAAMTLAAPANAQIPSRDSLRTVLKRATYVFEGVIERWNAVADPALALNPRHALVNVTSVFSCPVEVGEFTGEPVTIRYPNPRAAPAGTRAWFLGTGWTLGEHIATSVLTIVPIRTEAQSTTFHSRLHSAVRLNARATVRAESEAADMVVLATVQSIGSSYRASITPRSEHAERWSVASIVVDSIRGRNRSGGAWFPPSDAMRSITILAPLEITYYSQDARHLTPGKPQLLFLDDITGRQDLKSIDSTATAFLPSALAIHNVGDASLLGDALPNPLFGIEPVHACGRPIR
jgi:hypothetical protein